MSSAIYRDRMKPSLAGTAAALVLTVVMTLGMVVLWAGSAAAADEAGFEAEMLTLTPGFDECSLYFNWYSDKAEGLRSDIDVAKKSGMTGDVFPVPTILAAGPVGDATDGKCWHGVLVLNLEYDTEYVYRLSNDGNVKSRTYSFKTGTEGSFQFIAVGDPQLTTGMQSADSINIPLVTTKAGWQNTLDAISKLAPNARFLASLGDQVDGSADIETEYANFIAPLQSRSLPVAPTMGNHDGNMAFSHHFFVPNDKILYSLPGENIYGSYWYTYNNVLFVVLNSSMSPTTAAELAPYIQWMDETLDDATRDHPDADWIVVQHHKSTASPARHQSDRDILLLTPAFENLMDKYGVDVVLAGHDHVYSRSFFLYDHKVVGGIDYTANTVTNPGGTLYMTLNTASGQKYYDILTSAPFGGPVWNSAGTKPYYTNVGIQVRAPQFTTVDVTGASMTFTTYRSDTEEILDTYTIVKTSGDTDPAETDPEDDAPIPGIPASGR